MKYVIDRFEGGIAVLEDENGRFSDVDRTKLPKNAGEGDVIGEKNGEYCLCPDETTALKKEIESLCDELFE